MLITRSEQIFNHALRYATPFSTTLGHAWAIVPDGFSRYHGWPIRSTRFREWLAHSFHREHELFPGLHALNSAMQMLSAHAHHSEFPATQIFTRIGFHGHHRNPQSILIHLANDAEEIVEIAPSGHRLVTAQSWRFLSGAATAPLPRPIATTATVLEQLRPILNIDETALHRAVIWLFKALLPTGPYPVLNITGPPASGKSTLARILRTLIDPSAIPLLSPPAAERDLFTLALHTRVLAFDNVNFLSRTMTDALARIAAGTGIAIVSHNEFDDPQPLALERPIIITGRRPPAFIDSTLNINLDARKPATLRTENVLAEQIEAAAPAILGSLCAAISESLSTGSATPPALGLTTEQTNTALAANPLIDALHQLLQANNEWTGTPTQLQKALSFDGRPQHLSEQLNALPLSIFGIQLESWRSHRTRQIRLTTTPLVVVRRAAA
jgi:hypothetical protein